MRALARAAGLLCYALAATATATAPDSQSFALPDEFVGLWRGGPQFNVLGPLGEEDYTFSISKSAAGDYLFENNVVYDAAYSGYQRFYVEGYGETAGSLWYCGVLKHYMPFDAQTGDGRLNGFRSVAQTTSTVTFCLDTDNPKVLDGYQNPFQAGCKHCDCANWTIAYDASTDSLSSELSMSGAEGHTHSKHMWAELHRAGSAPAIDDADLPLHGSEFSCEFEQGGRDSVPVTRQGAGAGADGRGGDPRGAGCPHLQRLRSEAAPEAADGRGEKPSPSRLDDSYTHCYTLNRQTDFQLEWTLDSAESVLHCRISAPAADDNTWVGIGFRPASRSSDMSLVPEGTGHHMAFGMQGADLVVGSVGQGVRSLYAALYTGAPKADTSLQLSDAAVSYSGAGARAGAGADGRVLLSFTRPLVGGYLHANYESDASIVSMDADIIWAVGSDQTSADVDNGSTCNYHDKARGLRVVDWEDPSAAFYDSWKC
jgi:hypothetical protein